MKLVSVNVGLPRQVEWRGKTVLTSIFKAPVSGRVLAETLNLQGDQQSDLRVHGGVHKAVYAYPYEHYEYWRTELEDPALPMGAFGENFTTEGLTELSVCIGDTLLCGSAEFQVTQPRMPCYKLGVRFNRPDMVKRFHRSGTSGFYLSVVREGEVSAGDPIELIEAQGDRMPVAEVAGAFRNKTVDRDLVQRITRLPGLAPSWRDHFLTQLISLQT